MSPKPDPTPETAAPSIVALENPTTEQLLREQLAATVRENMQLVETHDGMIKKFAKLTEHRDALKAQVKELTKNPLVFALSRMDSGAVLADAGVKLGGLAKVVKRRQEKGKFVLELNLKPKANLLIFEAAIKVTEPKEEIPMSIFYVSDAGELARQDPDQKKFDFSTGDRGGTGDAHAFDDEESD